MASASVGAKDASGGGRRRTFAAPVLPLLLPTQRPPPGLPLMSLLVFFLVLLDTQYGSCRLAFVSPQQQSVEALPSLPPIPAAGGLVGRSATRRATGPGVPSWGAPTKGLLRIEATSPQSVQFSASDADECKVAAEAAATPPPDESPASAGGEVAALDGRRQGEGEEAPPRLSISKRRAEDRRMNWHRQYIYGPVDPTAALRREAATAARSESSQPPEILLQLAPQRRPSGRRWRLLEELEAGEEVRLAASAAAKDALDGICAAQQDRGAHGGPRRKSRASGGQTETVSLQTHMRRAALRAAAEAIEKEFYNMQRNPEGDSPPLGATTWDGGSSVTDAGDQEAPKVERRGLGPRTVYAAELRRLLLHRAALAAAEPLHGTGGGGAALAASKDATSEAAEGRPSLSTAPRVVSAATPAATEAASQSKGKSAGSKGNSKRLPLLDALLPREGVTYRPSSGLLTCQLLCTAGFDETIEVHVHLKRRKIRDGRIVRAPQRVQGFVTLPHGVIPSLLSGTGNLNAEAPAVGAREVRGKTRGGIWRRPRVIAALVEPGDEAAAKAAGADIVGIAALVASLEGGKKRGPDAVICTPELMAALSAHGKTLGRRNLIPSVAMGTLTEDPVAAIRLYRQPTIQFRADRLGVVHAPIGYASMETPQLLANFHAFLDALKAAIVASTDGAKHQGGVSMARVANSMHICSTMGPSVEIDLHCC